MAIYELTPNEIRPLSSTTFRDVQIEERSDLQRLLRKKIDIIAPGCLVLAEEFGDWDESRRRIDLLAIDKDAKLVVIELKRTEDGGHMELQAVRYASMVSTMTFDQAVRAHEKYLRSIGSDKEAVANILEHLEIDEPDEEKFAQDVNIVLASAEFSKELTSAVMWLNERGLDISCVKLSPYSDNGRILLDVQRVIPLPEVEDYQVRVREKTRREREARKSSRDYTKYMISLAGEVAGPFPKRETVFRIVKHLCSKDVHPQQIIDAVSFRKVNCFRQVPGVYESEAEFIHAAHEQAGIEGRNFDTTRWYLCDEERLTADGNTYVVSNGWGGESHRVVARSFASIPSARCADMGRK